MDNSLSNKDNPPPEKAEAAVWKFAEAEFDEAKWQLRVRGAPVELEPRPLEILLCLLRHAGETVTKEELLQAVWGHSYLSENALSNAVGKLRRALGDEMQAIIGTVHRVGYRLSVPVLRREPLRRPLPQLGLEAGDAVPGRSEWRLDRSLNLAPGSEVWLARKGEALRVFKFSADGRRLSSLKREAALSRLLGDTLGEREEFVRVLDWGFDQPPFFIECEYGGLSLPQWAESRGGVKQLPLAQRLGLLTQVAEAVAQAHSVGVLHKDLKPDNVLICERDGAPRVRLTDFGSGTLIDPARLAEWGITRLGTTQAPPSGTPLYLAPELLLGHSPTVQSDLYALGVMLYQLVIGDLRRPLSAGWERDIADDLLRQDIAESASGDPAHRLPSVKELAERLLNLDQRRRERALAARKQLSMQAAQRALERAQARRPWLIAAGSALSLGLAASLWFYHAALVSRDEERHETAIARAVNSFLNNDLLAAANPNVGGSMDVTVLDAIAKAGNKIDSGFASSPEISIALHQTAGGAYRTLANYAAAEHEFRQARATAYSAFGPDADAAIISDLLLAQDLAYQNNYEEAQSLAARIDALVLKQRYTDQMVPVRLWDVHALLDGHRTNRLAAAADAEQALNALQSVRAHHPRTYKANQDYAQLAQLHIGVAFQQAGQLMQAQRIESRLVSELTQARGARDPLTIQAREKWLDSLIGLGRYSEAADLLPALEADVRALSAHENPLHLDLLQVQASVAAAQNRWSDAVRLATQAENGYAQFYGVENDASILAIADSAAMLRASGQSEAAIAKYLEAYGLAARHQSDNGLLVQKLAYDLAVIYLDAGRPQHAQIYLAQLNPAALTSVAPDRDWTARIDYEQGRMAQQLGRIEQAQRDFAAALKSAQRGHDDAFLPVVAKELDRLPGPGPGPGPNDAGEAAKRSS